MSNELFNAEDKARLELGQMVRGQIISEMTKDGKLPASEEDRAFLMKALDSSDKVILAKAKIKSDDAAAKGQAAAAATVAEVLRRVTSRQGTGPRSTAPVLDVTDVEVVEGETHIGMQTFTLQEIMAPGKQS